MKLVFQNALGKERKIADVEHVEDAMGEIKKFCCERDFYIPYVRTWVAENNVMWHDVGSHSEYFKLYLNEPKEERL